jgi:hypothetical protein
MKENFFKEKSYVFCSHSSRATLLLLFLSSGAYAVIGDASPTHGSEDEAQ